MNINEFVHARKSAWERYRELLALIESRNYQALRPEQIEEFASLYRGVSADLASARTRYGDTELAVELNNLVSRGYAHLYAAKPARLSKFIRFFTHDYPALIADNSRAVFFSLAIFFAFTLIGYFAQSFDPRLADSFVPKAFLSMYEDEIRRQGHMDRDIDFAERSAFSTQIMTNNIQVSFMAFAGGMLFGIGTLYIAVNNAMMLGVMGKMFSDYGLTLNYLAFIMPHGALELPAILLAAAAGFVLGGALINPRGMTRGDSLRKGAGVAAQMMFGVVALLLVAGVIEGFFTPIIWIPDWVKVIVSGFILFAFLAWLASGFFGRAKAPARRGPALPKGPFS